MTASCMGTKCCVLNNLEVKMAHGEEMTQNNLSDNEGMTCLPEEEGLTVSWLKPLIGRLGTWYVCITYVMHVYVS